MACPVACAAQRRMVAAPHLVPRPLLRLWLLILSYGLIVRQLIQIGQDHIDLPYTAGQVYEMGLLKRLSVYARFAWQLFTALEKGVFRIPASINARASSAHGSA